MANNQLERELRSRIESFASELTELVRRSALESLRKALGDGAMAPHRGPGRPAGSVGSGIRRGPGRPPKAGAGTARRRKGGKRSPEQLQSLTTRFFDHVKKNPGRSMEQIRGALGGSTKDFQLPVRKLIDARKLRTTGQKRSTKYFVR